MNKIRLQNFRNHKDFCCNLQPGITLLTGLNGAGKTSIIEAIYITLQGKSWRSGFLDITNKNSEWWRVDIEIDGESRTVKFQGDEKKFIINKKENKILTSKNKKQVILFEPEDTRILYGSPKRRRDFLDSFISQIDEQYAKTIQKYTRVLAQRNKLLKNGFVNNEDILVWNINLARFGADIIYKRREWVNEINEYLEKEYVKICNKNSNIRILYKNKDTAQRILGYLDRNFEREKILGYTSVGPHRDDFTFLLNDEPAANKVSRGEGKILILMVFIILIKKYKVDYVIFDDLFNEIDIEKVEEIKKALKGIKNVFITDCRLLGEKFSNKIRL